MPASIPHHSRQPSDPESRGAALLSPKTDLPVRVAARGEVHAKVMRQDPVILDELGEGRPIGPPEPDLYLSLERHGRRNRVSVSGPQGKEASAG